MVIRVKNTYFGRLRIFLMFLISEQKAKNYIDLKIAKAQEFVSSDFDSLETDINSELGYRFEAADTAMELIAKSISIEEDRRAKYAWITIYNCLVDDMIANVRTYQATLFDAENKFLHKKYLPSNRPDQIYSESAKALNLLIAKAKWFKYLKENEKAQNDYLLNL